MTGKNPEWWNPSTWDWAKIGMIAASSLEIIGGVVLIAIGVGGPIGMTLIGMGTGSLINGFMNERSGGTFVAGWVGGQISGALAGFVPVVGATLGGFIGSVTTDIIDKGWNGINWKKASWCAVFAFATDILPGVAMKAMGESLFKSVTLQLLLSYRGAFVGAIIGTIGSFYKNE